MRVIGTKSPTIYFMSIFSLILLIISIVFLINYPNYILNRLFLLGLALFLNLYYWLRVFLIPNDLIIWDEGNEELTLNVSKYKTYTFSIYDLNSVNYGIRINRGSERNMYFDVHNFGRITVYYVNHARNVAKEIEMLTES